MSKSGRPKILKEPVKLNVDIERDQKDKLAILVRRLESGEAALTRLALDALFDANGVSDADVVALRKERSRRGGSTGIPGAKRPKASIARLVAVAPTTVIVSEEASPDMEKKGIFRRPLPLVAGLFSDELPTGASVVSLTARRLEARASRLGARGPVKRSSAHRPRSSEKKFRPSAA